MVKRRTLQASLALGVLALPMCHDLSSEYAPPSVAAGAAGSDASIDADGDALGTHDTGLNEAEGNAQDADACFPLCDAAADGDAHTGYSTHAASFARILFHGADACSGALLSDKWVLTVARCVVGKPLAAFELRFGEAAPGSADARQTRNLRRIVQHPAYIERAVDLALLELNTPVVPHEFVSPIAFDTTGPAAGSDGKILVPTASRSDAAAGYAHAEASFVSDGRCAELSNVDTEVCAVVRNGIPGCDGTLGAPITFTRNGRAYLAGTSNFISDGTLCGQYFVGARVRHHVSWIRNTMYAPLTVATRLDQSVAFDRVYDEKHSGWSGWRGLNKRIASSPALALDSEGTVHLFACAENAKVAHSSKSDDGGDWLAWNDLELACTDAPTAVVSRDTDPRLTVFSRGADGSIYYSTYDERAGRWSSPLSIGGRVASNPAAAATKSGRLYVFARHADDAIGYTYRDADSARWSAWETLGGSFTSGPAAFETSHGLLVVFAVNASGSLLHSLQLGSEWSEWYLLSDPDALEPTSLPSVTESNWGHRLVVFARSRASELVHAYYDDTAWSPWVLLAGDGKLSSGVGAL